jgi:tRNA U34 5-carboxymethylaminomethyl modifying enzyme MnmG/GidA
MPKNNLEIVILLLIGLIIGCSLGEQTEEANLLINEAKLFSDKVVEPENEFNSLIDKILNADLPDDAALKAYKKDNKAKFDELIILGEQLENNRNESVTKIEQASKLNLNDKFREYLELKVKENKKLAEIDKLKVSVAKEFATAETGASFTKFAKNYNRQKFAEMESEATEFSDKAKQIVQANPNVFEKK